MANFELKLWTNHFGKFSIFRLYGLLFFITQKGVFFFLEYRKFYQRKRAFFMEKKKELRLICIKKNTLKMVNEDSSWAVKFFVVKICGFSCQRCFVEENKHFLFQSPLLSHVMEQEARIIHDLALTFKCVLFFRVHWTIRKIDSTVFWYGEYFVCADYQRKYMNFYHTNRNPQFVLGLRQVINYPLDSQTLSIFSIHVQKISKASMSPVVYDIQIWAVFKLKLR